MTTQVLEYGRQKPSRVRALFASRRVRRCFPYLLVLLSCYVGSYVCVSWCGTFEPLMIGIGRVKSYSWAPAGFVKDWNHRWWLYYAYLPLYRADREWWHQDMDAYTGVYPVHEPNDVDEVRQAWRANRKK